MDLDKIMYVTHYDWMGIVLIFIFGVLDVTYIMLFLP